MNLRRLTSRAGVVDRVVRVEPIDRFEDDMAKSEGSVVTTMMLSGPPQVIRLMAELCI